RGAAREWMDPLPIPAAVARAPDARILQFAVVAHEREHRDLVTEIGQYEARRLERAVLARQRDVHAGIAEADDVRTLDAAQVSEHSRMSVHPPAAGFETEVGEHGLRLVTEAAVAIAQRHVHAGVAEADDVRPADAADVGEEARVPVHAPAAGFEAEVGH